MFAAALTFLAFSLCTCATAAVVIFLLEVAAACDFGLVVSLVPVGAKVWVTMMRPLDSGSKYLVWVMCIEARTHSNNPQLVS
jgi:hypothetical protein